MKNFRMWFKLSLGMGAILALVVIIGALSYRSLHSIGEEMGNLGYAYAPLQLHTMNVLTDMEAIPGNLNAYLYKRSPEAWKSTQDSLERTQGTIGELKRFIEASRVIVNTGRADRIQAAFSALEQNVQSIHDANERFIAQQAALFKLGEDISVYTGAFLTFQLNHVRKGVTERADNTASRVEVLRKIYALESLVTDIRARILRSVAEEDTSYCERNFDLIDTTVKKARELADFVITPEGKEFGTRLAADMTKFGEIQAEVMALWKQTDEIFAKSSQDLAGAVDLATQIVGVSREQQDGSMDAVENAVSRSSGQAVLFTLLAVLIGVALAVLMTRGITGPLGRAVVFARGVAAGDLSRRLRLNQKDEIGQLADALDGMVDSLDAKITEAEEQAALAQAKEEESEEALRRAQIAGDEAAAKSRAMLEAADRLEEVAGIVSTASRQLAAQIEQSGHGASEQAVRMTETATAMEEMNATVLEVAKNAGAAADVSASTRGKAEEGSAVVRRAVDSIRKVRDESLVLKQDMADLNDQAQAISRIMAVISDIADQTNLLALNAAIEAARAGDAGRGFAVVADEVRNLAEKTMASTSDVATAIKAIQDSTAKSMNQVDRAVREIEEATEFANQSDGALHEIVTMVDGTVDQVRAIATASEQQSAASEEINQSIGEVNGIAGEMAKAMNEAASAVAELAGQAHRLSELIEAMKRG